MPHSVSPEPVPEDSILPDAPAIPLEGQVSSSPNNNEAQNGVHRETVRLEDIFDSDDDDDDFLTSSAPTNGENFNSSPPPSAPRQKIDQQTESYSDPEVMRSFYSRLYPFRTMFQWLNHGIKPSADFQNREFAFTLQNEAYLRYQSFANVDQFRKDLLRLNPSRFEIGPVYSTNPRDRKTLRKASTFRPLSKELVFDIDLTDYDDVRTCCTGASICPLCWAFITMAIKVVDATLREDFGFSHILWVYSGRRGAHAWVSDKAARELDDSRRRAIAGYLDVVRGSAQAGKKVSLRRPLHPHLLRSLDILAPYFSSHILAGQDPWRTPDGQERLLALLPDKVLNDALRRKWEAAPGRASAAKWADIDALAAGGASKGLDVKALLEAKRDIVLEYAYPRLDVEVSKKRNHLLKAPFVVHPKTGRVCVPIEVASAEHFEPEKVPKVTELLGEVDRWEGEDEGGKVADYEKTSLKGHVDIFKRHVASMLRDEREKRDREDGEGEGMEF